MSRELKISLRSAPKGLGRLESSLNVVLTGQVEVEQRAEVHERLREADSESEVSPAL
jgi:hypothetical protein